MKLIPWIIIVAGAILAWFFWPEPKDQSDLIQKQTELIHDLNGKLQQKGYEISILVNEKEKDDQENAEKDRAFKTTIEGLNSRLAQRREKVVTIIQDNPDLKAFVETQDSVISVQGRRIDTLQTDLLKQSIKCDSIIFRFEDMIHVHAQKDSLQDLQIVGAMRDLRRQRRANRLGKVIAIGVGVLSFLAGNKI